MFHVNNGLYFDRLADGSVYICKKRDAAPESSIIFEQIISPDSWASVVAAVSAYGETAISFKAAEMFHKGERL